MASLFDLFLPPVDDFVPEVWYIKSGTSEREVPQSRTVGLTYLGPQRIDGIVRHYYRG